MPTRKKSNKKNVEVGTGKQPYAIDLIDPMFAVALHIGLTEGIFKEPWITNWSNPTDVDLFHLFTFLVGFTALALSWVGYHDSILSKPIKGIVRFIIDIILISFYALLLIHYKDFQAFLYILSLIFLIYVVWDVFKFVEHTDKYDKDLGRFDRFRREIVTLTWTVIIIVITISSYFYSNPANKGNFLIAAFVSLFVFRLNKGVPFFKNFVALMRKSLFDRLG